MKTETEYALGAQPLAPLAGNGGRRDNHESFADLLAADALKAKVAAQRAEVLGAQPDKPANPNAGDIAQIKEHGFRAYAEEVHAKKMEELREKILEKMGLTEEDLEAMPAAQRKTIEDMIAREIEARLAVNSMINGDDETADVQPGSGQIAAAVVAGESGKLSGGAAGMAVMAVLQADNALDARSGIAGEGEGDNRLLPD